MNTSLLEQQETPGFDPIGAAKDNAWKALNEIAQEQFKLRPSVGKSVRVIGGRKHKGKEGIVFWHGRNPYERTSRSGSDLGRAMIDARGTHGFRCGVRTETEKFFIDAKHLEVL